MTWETVMPFLSAALAACGYAIIINAPPKSLFLASVIGGLSWTCYTVCLDNGLSKVVAALIASILVALVSDIAARINRDAVTLFVIPGIIPMVPGAGMYYTMRAIIINNYPEATKLATETFSIAGAIALGLLAVGFMSRIVSIFFKPKADTRN